MKTMTGEELLKGFDLRLTPIRQVILSLFINKEYALSHADIEAEIDKDLDRVTVYRTLKTFLEKGLIHKILDNEGSLKYALCSEPCSASSHHHDHVHFKCSQCGQTNCLEIEVPAIRLPKGYTIAETNLLIQGICPNCAD